MVSESRKEYNRLRNSIVKEKEHICVNCNSTEDIEYHHIVPLNVGGTNNFSNIVPVCRRFHDALHSGIHFKDMRNRDRGGRPRKEFPDNYKTIIENYIYGDFGVTELAERMGCSKRNSRMLKEIKIRADELGIEWFYNLVDTNNSNRYRDTGRSVVSHIRYKDGSEEDFFCSSNSHK